MSHIHTDAGQIDHTVTLFVFRLDGDKPRTLLHMHRKHHRFLPFGGHVELDETPWGAAAHELREESGYSLEEVKVLQPKTRIKQLSRVVLHPQPVVMNTHNITESHFHSDTCWAFVASHDPASQPDEGESTDLKWFTRSELENLQESEIYANARETGLYIFDELLPNWEQVETSEFSTKKTLD